MTSDTNLSMSVFSQGEVIFNIYGDRLVKTLLTVINLMHKKISF